MIRLILAIFLAVSAASTARADTFEPTAFGVEVHGKGRPVLLVPGLGCPGSVWDGVSAHLVKLGYQTHVLTLSGFAGRPAIAHPLGDTARAEIVKYIADRKLDHPIVIGHSLGGFLAFWVAATAPDAVGPVVIADASPNMFADADPRDVAKSFAHWRGLAPTQFPIAVAQYFGAMAADRKLLDPVIAAVARSDRRVFVDALEEMATTDLRKQMAAIKAPVLVVIADGSKAFAQQVTAQIAPIKEHAMTMLPNTRHFIFFDDLAGFERAVDPFLASHQ